MVRKIFQKKTSGERQLAKKEWQEKNKAMKKKGKDKLQ